MPQLVSIAWLAAALALASLPAAAQAPDSCSGWYTQCTLGGSATQWIPQCEQARKDCLRTGKFIAPRNGQVHGENLKKR